MNTIILQNQDDDNNKGFVKIDKLKNVKPPSRDLFTDKNEFTRVGLQLSSTGFFNSEKNHVKIPLVNHTYNIAHFVGNIDLILPQPNNYFDWVGLWYHQDDVISKVRYETVCKIKIHGDGNRIMGYDEPMLCDIPFMSLKLTYINPVDGWVII